MLQKIKGKWEKVVKPAMYAGLLTWGSVAAAASDPFDKAKTKTDAITQSLAGPIALSVTALVVVIAGFALMFNKLSAFWAMRIIGGAIIIGGAASIAGFMYS